MIGEGEWNSFEHTIHNKTNLEKRESRYKIERKEEEERKEKMKLISKDMTVGMNYFSFILSRSFESSSEMWSVSP